MISSARTSPPPAGLCCEFLGVLTDQGLGAHRQVSCEVIQFTCGRARLSPKLTHALHYVAEDMLACVVFVVVSRRSFLYYLRLHCSKRGTGLRGGTRALLGWLFDNENLMLCSHQLARPK